MGSGGNVILHVPIFSALGMDEQAESVAIKDLVLSISDGSGRLRKSAEGVMVPGRGI